MKIENNEKYDMLKNKYSKFLFYNLNEFLNRKGLLVQFVRHTIISDDTYGLSILQEKNWSYFIENPLDVENFCSEVDIEANQIIIDTITNLPIYKCFYNNLYNAVPDNLHDIIFIVF